MARSTLRQRYNDSLIENLIKEAFNNELMLQASNIFKTLLSINFAEAGLKTLAQARDLAVKDVDDVISNKSERGLIRKFVNLFKTDKQRLMDALAFCDSMKNFFSTMVQYMDAKKTGINDPEKLRIGDVIIGKTDPKSSDYADKIRTFERLVKLGLAPQGILKKFSRTWQDKYLKNQVNRVAQELLRCNMRQFEDLAKKIEESLQNVGQVAQGAFGASNVTSQTSPTTGTEQSKSTQPSDASSQTDKTQQSGTGSTSNPDSKKALTVADKVFNDIRSDFGTLDPDTVKKVIAVLALNDLVKR